MSKGSVTTLQFQDDNTLISASDLDGIIKVIQNTTLRYRIYDESTLYNDLTILRERNFIEKYCYIYFQIWDLRRSYDLYSGRPKPKFLIPYAGQCALNGYSALLLDSSRTKLYASCKGTYITFIICNINYIAK